MRKLAYFAGIWIVLIVFGCSSAPKPEKPQKILVVLSGSDFIELKKGKRHPTGYFLSELAGPAKALIEEGYLLEYASPKGNAPVMDRSSDVVSYFSSEDELQEARDLVKRTPGLAAPQRLDALTEDDLSQYRALFVPGGHAPMQDLYRDPNMARVLTHFHNAKKPTALLCHGPVALLSTNDKKGDWIYSGYQMTVFSDEEEKQNEASAAFGGKVKFYPQAGLSAAGAIASVGAPWTSHVVRDRELITGQNPMSEEAFRKELLKALEE